ncbi:MAG: 23S rRNA (uracil(1939)-C(5))-methyltransferase RlmD [Acinetobacter sp.]|nr:23S rRNA (uracil(1939)-C(5))-methyltransferase RlmD [Acinetobacter sp.]
MEHYPFTIQSLSHEGRGVALYGTHPEHPTQKHGKKVFIRYALAGEQVQARITHSTKRLEEADGIEILQASPHRVEPFCQHYGQCGGCSLQHLDLEQQIIHKQQVLQSHLQHFAQAEPEQWLAPIRSQRSDYRRRARIGVRYLPKNQRFLFGFRAAQSNHLVNIEHCPILDHQLNAALPALKQCLASLKAKADIGHIELVMGDDDVSHNIALLVRQTAKFSTQDIEKLQHFCQQRQWILYLQAPNISDIRRFDDGSQAKNGADLRYAFPQYSLQFAFSPSDFTQVNSTVNRQMVALACELLNLKAGERVLDLFCGLGNFSLPLARLVGESGRVIGVEGSREMVQRATANAKLNGLKNTQFYAQDLTQDLSKTAWAKQGFDAILIDPPRTGAWEIMAYLPKFNAQRIVYVSCNPATLARDSQQLIAQGYVLKKAGIMDMFSHTGHVESIALFEKIRENEI